MNPNSICSAIKREKSPTSDNCHELLKTMLQDFQGKVYADKACLGKLKQEFEE